MRFSATAAISAAALLTGTVNADAQSVLSEASSSVASVASDASSAATSATELPELPTFTVSSRAISLPQAIRTGLQLEANVPSNSLLKSRATLSSNSRTIGRHDGSRRTPRRTPKAPTKMRSGHTSVNGPSKNHTFTREWRAIRVWS